MIELVEQTIDQQIDGGSIYFKLSEEEDIAKAKLINELQKKADEEISQKKVSGGLYEFYNIKQKDDKVKKKKVTFKINLELYVCYKFYT